ncbi:MAG: PEGA domain-containing protein [Ignavibacteriae bacterium]|nr:PEGA domain-containing protein [Ignavibacteriota bacterium]
MKKIFLLILIFVFNTCRSKLPIESDPGYGKIFIQSNIDSSEIFLEGTFSGKFTPDTLEILAVTYRIKVAKENYFSEEKEITINKNKLVESNFNLNENNLIKNVFVELFSYSYCDTCDVSKIIQNINHGNDEKIFIINYASDYPNYDEVFYYDFWNGMIARGDYYDILQIPAIFVNGSRSYNLQNEITREFKKNINFTISVYDSLVDGNGMNINIFIDVSDLHGIDFNSLVLRNALVEKEVDVNNSNKKVQYILRKFIPDFNGKSLSSISARGRAKFAEFTLVDPHWNKENLYVISFVQNELTKEVLQVGSSK